MNKAHTDNGFHNTKKHPILPLSLPPPHPPLPKNSPPPSPKELFVGIQDVAYVLREI